MNGVLQRNPLTAALLFAALAGTGLNLWTFSEFRDNLEARRRSPEFVGEQLGPAWVWSKRGFEPASVPFTLTQWFRAEGTQSRTFHWRNPAAEAERGPVRVTVRWSDAPQPRWQHLASICEYIEDVLMREDGADSIPWVGEMPRDNVTYCSARERATGASFIYVARVHPPRCEHQVLTVARTAYVAGDYSELTSEVTQRAAMNGANLALAAGLGEGPQISVHPECAGTITRVRTFGGALVVALAGGILLLIRSVRCIARSARSDAPPEPAAARLSRHPTSGEEVLLVEPKEHARMAAVKALRNAGVSVVAYADCDDLLGEPLRRSATKVLVSIDAADATRVLKEVRAHVGELRIIAVVGREPQDFVTYAEADATIERDAACIERLLPLLDLLVATPPLEAPTFNPYTVPEPTAPGPGGDKASTFDPETAVRIAGGVMAFQGVVNLVGFLLMPPQVARVLDVGGSMGFSSLIDVLLGVALARGRHRWRGFAIFRVVIGMLVLLAVNPVDGGIAAATLMMGLAGAPLLLLVGRPTRRRMRWGLILWGISVLFDLVMLMLILPPGRSDV